MGDSGAEEGLLAIFLAEADDILAYLAAQLTELQYGYDGQGVLDDIHRSFHTLYGGSRVLELKAIAELSFMAAQAVRRLRGRRSVLGPRLTALIESVVHVLGDMLGAARAGQRMPELPVELRRRLEQVAKDGRVETAQSKSASSPAAAVGPGARRSSRAPAAADARAPRVGQLTDFSAAMRAGAVAESQTHAAPAARNSQRLVEEFHYFSRELNWVRDLLLRLEESGNRDERRRALEFLDLLARDMGQWAQRTGQSGDD